MACLKIRPRSFSWLRGWFEQESGSEEIHSHDLPDAILSAIETNGRKRPKEKLARSLLRKLFWIRWRNRTAAGVLLMIVAVAGVLGIESKRGYSEIITQFILWSARFSVWQYAETVHPWEGTLKAANILNPADLYRATNVWPVHLQFTHAQWNALSPKKVEALPNFMSDGKILLRNPKVAGVMGYVGVRIKGNRSQAPLRAGLHL